MMVMDWCFAEGGHVRYDEDGEAYGQQPPEHALMTIDNWLHLRVPMQQVAHICCLRHRLTQAFAAKVVPIPTTWDFLTGVGMGN